MRFRWLLAAILVGCSSSPDSSEVASGEDARVDDASAETSFDDAGNGEDASDAASDASDGATDAPPETWVVDAAAPDVAPFGPCTIVGSKEAYPCGTCGRMERTCLSTKTWGPFGPCVERTPECKPGEKRAAGTCGKCGTREESCTSFCEWFPGPCVGEGVCAVGDSETIAGECTAPLEVKVRSCTSSCTWGAPSACALPKGWQTIAPAPSAYGARTDHTAVWTGSTMIVWSGFKSSGPTNNGAEYDPSTNGWKMLPDAPITGRIEHVAVWTGSEMIVWGGRAIGASGTHFADGAVYSKSSGWSVLPASPLAARAGAFAAWSPSTKEMIVWGGRAALTRFTDGAAYDPVKKTWRTLPAPARTREHGTFSFAGGKLVLFGGFDSGLCGGYCIDADAWDPPTSLWKTHASAPFKQRWDVTLVPTSSGSLLVWGGDTSVSKGGHVTDGALLDLASGTWKSVAAASGAPRTNALAWSSAGKIYLWGGKNPDAIEDFANGFVYDVASDTWSAMPTTGAPSARHGATVVWTGSEAIVWGGARITKSWDEPLNDGRIFRP